MDAREAKTPQTYELCKQLSHNQYSCPNRETNDRIEELIYLMNILL